MDINKKIYLNVKALSVIKGIDMKDVERKIGRTPGYLSRKSTRVDVETLIKLAALFGVKNDDLMDGNWELEQKKIEVTNALTAAVSEAKKYLSDGVLRDMLLALVSGDETQEGGEDDVRI